MNIIHSLNVTPTSARKNGFELCLGEGKPNMVLLYETRLNYRYNFSLPNFRFTRRTIPKLTPKAGKPAVARPFFLKTASIVFVAFIGCPDQSLDKNFTPSAGCNPAHSQTLGTARQRDAPQPYRSSAGKTENDHSRLQVEWRNE